MKTALKKFFMPVSAIFILSATLGLAVAEDKKPDDNAKTETDVAQATGLAKFAGEIAQYGKAQQDPIALISAARILKESGVKETVPAKKSETSISTQPVAEAIKEWLDEARKIANESNKNKDQILALADEVGKNEPKTRGWYHRHVTYYYHPDCW